MQAQVEFKELFKNLGQEMVGSGMITSDQLAVANVTLDSMGGTLGPILIKKGFVGELDLNKFIAQKLEIPMIKLRNHDIDAPLMRAVPYTLANKFSLVPVEKKDNVITLALSDPLSLNHIDEIKNTIQSEIHIVLASKNEVMMAIRANYDKTQEMRDVDIDEVEVIKEDDEAEKTNTADMEELASSVGAVSAVNSIFLQAYTEHASDIHIEPQRDYVRVRLRIDGKLEERQILPRRMMLPVTSRIKVLSGMNIAERRAPQDGRIKLKISGNFCDMRTSSYPSAFGEKIVIRLLRKDNLIKMSQLGFSERDIKVFKTLIHQPHGIILVTGPTGSGKSTTLYAALQQVNSLDRNIVSIEDPIESEIPGVNQAQVNNKANMTFASALRSILRQDPDIIMLGEIRDGETAEMALRAAMTGHLVFSTLHTNTAIGAVPRLSNLGVPDFLISSTILGLMAQRLIRVICDECREPIKEDPELLERIGLSPETVTFTGRGCSNCRDTGFTGRVGIFELIPFDSGLKGRIEKGATEEELLEYLRNREDYLSMSDDGRQKVLNGTTTVKEVVRVTEI